MLPHRENQCSADTRCRFCNSRWETALGVLPGTGYVRDFPLGIFEQRHYEVSLGSGARFVKEISMIKIRSSVFLLLLAYWLVLPTPAIALDTINVALTSK